MSIVLQKKVKIASRGRYVTNNKGAVIGPQVSYYNESVTAIKYLLDKYPAIKIVELLKDGRTVNLTKGNYNKDNNVKSVPVAVTEEPKKEDDATHFDLDTALIFDPSGAENEEPAEHAALQEEEPKKEDDAVEPEKVEEPDTTSNNNQQSKKDRNRNKNKNNQQQANKSTEVTPEEP